MTDDIPEITEEQWGRAVDGRVMRRLRRGDFRGGEDVALLRKFVGMTQEQFALTTSSSSAEASAIARFVSPTSPCT
jgi:hypothetical protein